jgi:hypothetical protein
LLVTVSSALFQFGRGSRWQVRASGGFSGSLFVWNIKANGKKKRIRKKKRMSLPNKKTEGEIISAHLF